VRGHGADNPRGGVAVGGWTVAWSYGEALMVKHVGAGQGGTT
jgi:hypothetical protein